MEQGVGTGGSQKLKGRRKRELDRMDTKCQPGLMSAKQSRLVFGQGLADARVVPD